MDSLWYRDFLQRDTYPESYRKYKYTDHVDIMTHDSIFFPINVNKWVLPQNDRILAVIKNAKYIWLSNDDFDADPANENCEILIIDSFGNKNKAVFENILT